MSVFNEDKTKVITHMISEKKTKIGAIIVERPRICCIDLTKSDFDSLKDEGFNLYQGTLGATMEIPNKLRNDYAYILHDYDLPINLHEYDILILDLTNEQKKEYKKEEHISTDTKQKNVVKLTCSYPTTVFDPRPLTSSFLASSVSTIRGRKFLQIIFACQSYDIEYEIVNITNDNTQRFPNEKHNIYSFSNSISPSVPRIGKEVNVCSVRDDLFFLLNKHSRDLNYYQTFHHPMIWNSKDKQHIPDPAITPLLKNINDEIVSFAQDEGHLITFVFPDIKDKANFLREFLKNFCPSIVPELFPFSTQFKWKELRDYFLPNHSALLVERKEIAENFEKQNEGIKTKISDNFNKFKFLHELITETGDNLVHAVHKFLKWLEFKNVAFMDELSTSILEEDLQVEHDKGLLIIETKGIGGTSSDSDCSQIAKIKLRRCKERNAFDVSALYIVNHQRYLPPLKRKNPPFSENQIKDSFNDERGLVTTWQLFNLYFDIQNGIITKEDARIELLKFGLIEFRPNTKDKLATPKEILKEGYVVILDIDNTKLEVGQTLIAEKSSKYFKTRITSIKVDDKSVNEITTGEVGLKLETKISNGTTLWTE